LLLQKIHELSANGRAGGHGGDRGDFFHGSECNGGHGVLSVNDGFVDALSANETHHVVGVEVFHGADVFAREGTRSGHFGVIPGFGTSFGGNVGHGEGDNARLEHEGNHFENVCRGCFAFGEERLKQRKIGEQIKTGRV